MIVIAGALFGGAINDLRMMDPTDKEE